MYVCHMSSDYFDLLSGGRRRDRKFITFPDGQRLKWLIGSSHSDAKVIDAFCTMMEYETNMVRLTVHRRKQLAEVMRMSAANISRSIGHLKSLHAILGEQGDYFVNPYMFWKGTMCARAAAIKLNPHLVYTFVPEL